MNPFEEPPQTIQQPVAGNISRLFGEATQQAKESVLSEATDLGKAAMSISGQMKVAKRSGDVGWMNRLKAHANKLVGVLWEFIKKAIELAVFKLVLELCAQIMNSIMDALTSRGNNKMEITTPGVYLQPKGGPAQQATSNYSNTSTYSSRPGNPFDYRPSSVSPW